MMLCLHFQTRPLYGRAVFKCGGFTKMKNFKKWVSNLKNGSVCVSTTNAYPQAESASVRLLFADGSKLQADYWRIIKGGKARISSFDHQQQYGLPAPLDAIMEAQKELRDKTVTDVHLDAETGDLLFQFTEGVKFQAFNFTGYEVWDISFPDGTVEYSNQAKTMQIIGN
jgi:hypothetical protein